MVKDIKEAITEHDKEVIVGDIMRKLNNIRKYITDQAHPVTVFLILQKEVPKDINELHDARLKKILLATHSKWISKILIDESRKDYDSMRKHMDECCDEMLLEFLL